MALKQEIVFWDEAVKFHDKGELEKALNTFNDIADTSRILFNCGVIHASLGEHAAAVNFFNRAVARDQYLAVAYFQCGVSNFLLGEFEEALANFNDTILCLRGNAYIDYEQLGLKYKLHFCEALFNRGLCYIYLQQKALGMQDLRIASTKKATQDHSVIDEAIEEEAEGFVVFSIPRGIIYRPNAAKVKNLTSKDYLGKARLIASQQQQQQQQQQQRRIHSVASKMHGRNASESVLRMDLGREHMPPPGTRAYAPRPGLSSRSRQQSEPPLNRANMFPPTPPPENIMLRPYSSSGRTADNANEKAQEQDNSATIAPKVKSKPTKLELGYAAFDTNSQEHVYLSIDEKPRLGTVRSASEQPRPRGENGNSSRREHRDRKAEHRRSLRVDTRDDTYTLQPKVYDAVNRSLEAQQQLLSGVEEEDGDMSVLLPVAFNSPSHSSPRSLKQPSQQQQKSQSDPYRPTSITEECEDDTATGEHEYPDSAVSGIPPTQPGSSQAIVTLDGSLSPASASLESSYNQRINADSLPYELPSPNRQHNKSVQHQQHIHHSASSTPPTITMDKIRVKVHGERDTRYIMTTPSVSLSDLIDQVRRKPGLLSRRNDSLVESAMGSDTFPEFKLKVRDEEGDMVTLGDQEDLEMAVQAARDVLVATVAASGSNDREAVTMMGKMEIWIQEV